MSLIAAWRIPDWASVLGFFLAIVGLVLALVAWQRPKERKKFLAWNAATTVIADPRWPGVEVRYEGKPVQRVMLTVVTFEAPRNSAPIKGEDVLCGPDPVRNSIEVTLDGGSGDRTLIMSAMEDAGFNSDHIFPS